MKGPLGDELDAGGTIKSVPYPGVLKDIKKRTPRRMFIAERTVWKEPRKSKKGGAEAPPFPIYS
jgi:hypothetical protein